MEVCEEEKGKAKLGKGPERILAEVQQRDTVEQKRRGRRRLMEGRESLLGRSKEN